MIRITLKTPEMTKKLLAPEHKSIKDILQDEGITVTPFDSAKLDGKELSDDDLDSALAELGFNGDTELTLAVNMGPTPETDDQTENLKVSSVFPPKARIIGCACIICSAFTPQELRDFRQYLPDALTRRDENGDPVFAVSLDETCPGSLNRYGAVFSRIPDSDGHATITILVDPECDDIEEAVRHSLGSAILNLVDMEEYLMARLPEVKEKKDMLDLYINKR